MRAVLAFALPCLAFASPAAAGDLDVRLTDARGQPVADAVVTVHPASGVPKGPIAFPWGSTMVQQNIAFSPHVLIVPVGATVRFPNKDNVRHHVYSFSKPARFEIKLFGRDESRSYTFKSTGAVAIGCNIHDQMSGFIKVVDTPFAARSDGGGRARIGGLAPGQVRVTIWHPQLRAPNNEIVETITQTSGTVARSRTLTLRAS